MKSVIITLLMFFYFSLHSFDAQAQVYKRICVIGSSTSWGYFNGMYPRDSGYAFKLSKYYQSLGLIDTLYNIASNGSDPYFGMPSSYTPPPGRDAPDPRFNITRAVNFNPKPDVIIVNYPSNHYDYFTASEVLACLQTIKDSANIKGIVCYITTSQPRDNFNAGERQNLLVLRDSILNRFGEFALNFYDPIVKNPEMIIRPEYSLGDGVHTNPAGQTVLENVVIDKNILLSVLPVNFISVTGASNTGSVKIEWSINGAENNDRFAIQRSNNGINFINIGEVSFSVGKTTFQYTDLNPSVGINYYRIVRLGADNRRTISKIISVNFKSNPIANIFFDNNSKKLHLHFFQGNSSKPATIQIFDQAGNVVLKRTIFENTGDDYQISLVNLPREIYSILLTVGNQKITKNIMN